MQYLEHLAREALRVVEVEEAVHLRELAQVDAAGLEPEVEIPLVARRRLEGRAAPVERHDAGRLSEPPQDQEDQESLLEEMSQGMREMARSLRRGVRESGRSWSEEYHGS